MNFSKYNFKTQLNDFLEIKEDGDGGGPMTVAATGLPTTGADAFIGKTHSNLEGATAGYYYDHTKKSKKAVKKKLKKSFMDYLTEEKISPMNFAMKIDVKELKEVFGAPIYEFGSNKYTVKFYRKGEPYSYGKMFFVGNDAFAMRFNRRDDSKNEIDSISFWSRWTTKIINEDINFSTPPDADVVTEGLSLEKCYEVARQIYKNQKPRFLRIENIKIEKKGKPANKEFEQDLGRQGKEAVSFTELLDFASKNGYNIVEPSDGSLNINLVVPMKVPDKEFVIPHQSEYSKSVDVDTFVKDGRLILTSVNIQNFVSSIQHAEELLEYFRSLFKDNIINKLSFEAIVFSSKVRESKHPEWLKLLVPRM